MGDLLECDLPWPLLPTNLTQLGVRLHNDLQGLTIGDPHTMYLLLAGRIGTTNDPLLSTNGDGTITGSAASGGDLYALSTSHPTKGALRWNDTQVWWEDMPDFTAGAGQSQYLARFDATFTAAPDGGFQHIWNGLRIAPTATLVPVTVIDSVIYQVINHAATVTMGSNVAIRCIVDQSTYINTASAGFGSFILFQASQTLQSNTTTVAPYGFETFVDGGTSVYNSTSTATASAGLGVAYNDRRSYTNNSTGTFAVTDHSSFRSAPRLIENAGTLTLTTLRRFYAVAYSVTGSPAITTDVAVEIDDLSQATLTTAISLRSAGSAVQMRHTGPAVFGANAAPNNASTGLELSSTTLAFLPSRMTQTQRDALTGVDGMLIYNSTTGQHDARQGARWNAVSGWHVVIVKSADQTVTNNATLQDDTELQFSVTANEVWHVELRLGMSGNNTTGDGKVGLTAAAGSFVTTQSNWEGVYYGGTGTLTDTAPTAFASTTEAVTGGTTCLNGDGTLWPVAMTFRFRASATTTIKVQFANVAAAGGRTTTMEAGSLLFARRVA